MLTGDDAAIEALARDMATISSATHRIAVGFRSATDSHLRGTFAAGTDPYGAAWSPLKHRSGSILKVTGKLQSGIKTTIAGESIRVRSGGTRYAWIHMRGAVVVARGSKGTIVKYRRGKNGRIYKSRKRTRGRVIGTIPARPFLPDYGRGIPAALDDRYLVIAATEVVRHLKA